MEVYELVGAGAARSRLQAAAARGLTRFVGRDAEMEQLAPGPRARGRRARAGGGGGRRARRRQVAPRTGSSPAPTGSQGWLVLESRLRLLRQGHAATCRSSTCSRPTSRSTTATTPRRDAREGHRQAADASTRRCEPTLPALLALLDVPVEDAAVAGARPAAAPPAHAGRGQAPAAAREPGAAAAGGLRGPALDRLRDPGAARQPGREPADRAAAAPRQLPAGVPARLGRARPTTRSSGSTPCRPRAPTSCCMALLGADADASSRSSAVLIARTGGNPFFLEESVRTLVETGVAGRRARGLPAGRGRSRHPGARHGPGDPGRAHRPAGPRGEAAAADGRRHRQGRAVRAAARPSPSVPEAELRRGLARLQAAEFLYETSLFPELEYTFKHALTHEVAYGEPAAASAAARSTRGSSRRSSSVYRRPARRARRAAGPPRRSRARCGTRRSPTSGRPAPRPSTRSAYREAVAAFRAGARRPRGTCRRAATRCEQAIDLRLDLRSALLAARRVRGALDLHREADALAGR